MPMSPRLLRPRAAAATGFTPLSIADLGLWLDATDASSYTETSGQISEWRDKSGNARHFTQTTANNRPTLFTSSGNVQTTTAAAINGVQAFFFDGTNDVLIGNAASRNILRNVAGATAVAVVRVSTSNAHYGIQGNGSVFQLRAAAAIYARASTGFQASAGRVDATGTTTLASGANASTDPNVKINFNYICTHVIEYSTASQRALLNATQVVSGAVSGGTGNTDDTDSNSSQGVIVGGLRTNAVFGGLMGEFLIYRRALTSTELAAIDAYLSAKWSITLGVI